MNSTPRLREARRAAGLKQHELARRLGLSQSVIARYETGTRKPRVEIAVRLAAALDTTVEAIWPADERGPAPLERPGP